MNLRVMRDHVLLCGLVRSFLFTHTHLASVLTNPLFCTILYFHSYFVRNLCVCVMSTSGIASAAATTAGRATVSASARSSHRRCSPLVDRILRVDHAGELGADRIYAGQMAVLGK